jgi:hypothetical protein
LIPLEKKYLHLYYLITILKTVKSTELISNYSESNFFESLRFEIIKWVSFKSADCISSDFGLNIYFFTLDSFSFLFSPILLDLIKEMLCFHVLKCISFDWTLGYFSLSLLKNWLIWFFSSKINFRKNIPNKILLT